MITRTMTANAAGPWAVAQPLLVQRSQSLMDAIECCRGSVDNPEHIHELRVASRRLEAALKSFASLLPPKQQRRLKKQVRRIRRAAGRIRDLDVLILRLEKSHVDSAEEAVVSVLQDERRLLAQDLTRQLSQEQQDRLHGSLQDVSRGGDNSSKEPTTNLAQWAASRIQPTARRFLDAAHHDLHRTRDLHRLRLCGKQLRYSLELFQGQLDPDRVSRVLKALRGIQEQLGDMNDHSSAHQLLSDVAATTPDEAVRELARRMAKQEKRLLKRDRRRFLKWWQAGAARRIDRRVRRCVLGESAAAVES